MTSHLILAYYFLEPLEDCHKEIQEHLDFCGARDIKARIYISESGINGQFSGLKQHAIEYMDWMHAREPFQSLPFKINEYHEHVFPRLAIKYRKQLVALDREVDFSQAATHLAPEQWKQYLETHQDAIVVDVRNDYEWQLGRFKGAELPPCESFREFNDYADSLKERVGESKAPVMMYCTGGIRCELYSSILREKGIENIYQLEGGVINYGQQVGSEHWQGKLFVFDDRLSVPIAEQPTEVIGKCLLCETPSEDYYNCANMDCNKLFLCCQECLPKHAGCCQESCHESPRIRPYHQQDPHKPFRRWHHYFKEKPAVVRE